MCKDWSILQYFYCYCSGHSLHAITVSKFQCISILFTSDGFDQVLGNKSYINVLSSVFVSILWIFKGSSYESRAFILKN